MLGVAFEVVAVATAMPVAMRDLDALPLYAWSFSTFVVGMLLATVATGRLSDRIGPSRPLLLGVALFVAGLVLAGTAPSVVQLLGGRLVQGLGGGTINTAMTVAIAQVFAPSQRPRVFTFISTAWVLPSFVGPPVSAWVTQTLGWHWVFLSVVPLALLGAGMVLPSLLAMMRSRRSSSGDGEPAPAPAPLWAGGLVAIAAVTLQVAGQRLDVAALALLVAGVAALVLGLPRLMPPGFLRAGRGLAAVVLVRGLLPGAFFGAEAFLPLMLVEQRGVSLFLSGATLTVGSVGWTAGSWLQARPWFAVRRDRFITWGAALVAAGIAVVALSAAAPGVWVGVVGVGWVIAGLGMGLGLTSTNLAMMTLSPAGEQGRNAASLGVGESLGAGLFIAGAGTAYAALRRAGDSGLLFSVPVALMALVALAAVAASLRVGAIRNEFAPGPQEGSREAGSAPGTGLSP